MKVDINTCSSGIAFQLKRAILLYEKYSEVIATVHDVKDKQIQPGTPIDKEKLTEIINSLSNQVKPRDLQIVPENLIAWGEKSMMWFAPSRVSEIYFKTGNKALDKLSGTKVRYPGIVFFVKGQRMTAYAVYGNARPGVKNKLYQMPFYNCSGDGWVCLPSGRRPKPEPDKIEKWETLFFKSNFSHSGTGAIVRGGHNKFWLRYVDQCRRKMPKRFPCEYLLPTLYTIEEIINNED
jgi:PRTRC genetic system protein B